MSDVTPVTSRGFKSALRVRLLHAQVRRKIRLGKGREKTYDEDVSGVPINQVYALSVSARRRLALTFVPSPAISHSSSGAL